MRSIIIIDHKAKHKGVPSVSVNVPGWQSSHIPYTVAADTLDALPALHLTQRSTDEMPRALEYVPRGQVVHCCSREAACTTLYLPLPQFEHDVCPAASEKVPAVQFSQTVPSESPVLACTFSAPSL